MSRKIQTLLPFYGGNRTSAEFVAGLLQDCRWIGVPFCGGMPELLHLQAGTILVSDLHLWVINLARAVQDDPESLLTMLNGLAVHETELSQAQDWCRQQEPMVRQAVEAGQYYLTAAAKYFICQWMGRSGKAGTKGEFTGKLPVRMTSSGGGTGKRYRTAVESLSQWQDVMRRCEFVCWDVFEFLDKVVDQDQHGLYLDAPWPDAGAQYRHSVDDETFHRKLRDRLLEFRKCRIVVRYGSHPVTNQLYQDGEWTVMHRECRTQHDAKSEVYYYR